MNSLVGSAVDCLRHETYMYHVCWAGLVVHNIIYCAIVLVNPGVSPRNPNMHSETYLRTVAARNHYFRICKTCKIIHRDPTTLKDKKHLNFVISPIYYNTHHCEDCNVCVEGHETHFLPIGKCVGVNNLWLFNLMLVTYIWCAFSFIFGLLQWLDRK